MWSSDVIGIARESVADDLGVDLGTPLLSVLKRFQYQDRGPLTQNKPIAIFIERARGAGGLLVTS